MGERPRIGSSATRPRAHRLKCDVPVPNVTTARGEIYVLSTMRCAMWLALLALATATEASAVKGRNRSIASPPHPPRAPVVPVDLPDLTNETLREVLAGGCDSTNTRAKTSTCHSTWSVRVAQGGPSLSALRATRHS